MSLSKIVSSLSLSLLSVLSADGSCKQPTCPPSSECSFQYGGDLALSYDYFRSLPDGSWSGNTGAYTSINLAFGIPKEEYGFGAQIGGSYGLYDWDGRVSAPAVNSKALQQQGFATAGLFRMTPHCSGVNAGLAYDVMFNRHSGVFAVNPNITQLRGQLGYLIRSRNEVGLWATYDTNTSHKTSAAIPLRFRAVSQVNLFWSHYFRNTAQTSLWFGTPYRKGLMYTSGRAGRYTLGVNFRAPLMRKLSIVGHAMFMAPASQPVVFESRNYAANICFGLNYSFGGCKGGQRPYMPLADNSNFIVDTNVNL